MQLGKMECIVCFDDSRDGFIVKRSKFFKDADCLPEFFLIDNSINMDLCEDLSFGLYRFSLGYDPVLEEFDILNIEPLWIPPETT